MAYIAPLHRPSGVRTAIKLNLLDEDQESLVVAKANRLEIYQITADGIILQHSKTIYGTITLLTKLRPPDSTTDLLFVGTDRYAYFTLSWDPVKNQLETVHPFVDLADKLARPSQSLERCVVDPAQRFLTLEVFEGTLTVVPLYVKEKGKGAKEEWNLGEPIPIRVSERFVRSLGFLHTREVKVSKQAPRPSLAVLYDDGQNDCRVVIKSLEHIAGTNNSGNADFVDKDDIKSKKGEVEFSSSHLLPVEKPSHGFLILSEASITYWNNAGERGVTQTLAEPTIWSCWAPVDAERWLLADDYGKLYFLGLVTDDEGFGQSTITALRLDPLGQTSRASVLVYLDAGYFYLGSKSGDSQVIRIDANGSIEVVQTLPGIAPIIDFVIMDMGSRSGEGSVNEYSSGQARIVAGSGAWDDGSLRSVRSGVGIEDLGSLGNLEHVTSLFPLRAYTQSFRHDTILASFVNETRAFRFSNEGEVEEAETFHGFTMNVNTILASNLSSNKILHVTSKGVQLSDVDDDIVSDSFDVSSGSIVAAAADDQHVVISINSSELVVLSLRRSLKVVAQRKFKEGLQVSCLDLPEVATNSLFVGFWQSSDIAVLKVPSLETITQQSVSAESVVPRSLVVAQLLIGHDPTLLVAMADGTIASLDVNLSTLQLTNLKSTILGTQQATLQLLPRINSPVDQVFATCEHPSLIYGSEGRLIYSAVTMNDAACVCSFDSASYPGAIAVATSNDLRIALIDSERTTHVQSLHIGQTVRRIAYSSELKAFGLGCIKRSLSDGAEIIQSSFKLADEVVFRELDSFDLDAEEIIESVIRAPLRGSRGKINERFVVGTSYIEDGTEEAVRGRLLLFEVTQDRQLTLLASKQLKSACRALAVVNGKIAAALMKTLVIYSEDLQKLATIRTSTATIDMSVNGNVIALGDLMKSISVVRFTEGEDGESGKLEEIARHFQTAWTTAIAEIDENTYLESDAEGNLIVLRQNINGVTKEDRRRLETISEFRLGEMVNRIRPVKVSTSATSAVIPKAFLATVEGSLYLFGAIRPEKQDLLMTLQTNMAKFIKSPGSIPFHKYRAYHSLVRDEDEPFRFVDGELIESFLDCTEQIQTEMVQGLKIGVEEVRAMVENLRRMH